MDFQQLIKKFKLETGLTNPEIAKLLGVPLRTLESWKSGSRTPSEFVQNTVIGLLSSYINNNINK